MIPLLPSRSSKGTPTAQKGFNGVLADAINRVPEHQLLQLTTLMLVYRLLFALITVLGAAQMAKSVPLQQAAKLYQQLIQPAGAESTRPRAASD